ncbi:MAG: type VI secretion system-associated protein TagF [Roseibium sp.]|uniref:type VI secretion system-associated protein TagF n=1 Tax=Roseibium sp. TaxID=1936156 RepID=UPI003296A43D
MKNSGYFGKRPLERDFVFDGLSAGLTDAWAGVMSDWLHSVQNELPHSWQRQYFEAPAWRFAIEPGLLGPSSWCGLLLACADALGRSFPLTVLIPVTGAVDHLAFESAVDAVLDALEVRTMDFVEGTLSRKAFAGILAQQAALLSSGPPPVASSRAPVPLDAAEQALRIRFARTGTDAIIAEDALVFSLERPPAPGLPLSYWWQDGSATRPPELCIWKGLPRGRETGGFFSGEWARFGWTRGQIDPGSPIRPWARGN